MAENKKIHIEIGDNLGCVIIVLIIAIMAFILL